MREGTREGRDEGREGGMREGREEGRESIDTTSSKASYWHFQCSK